MVSRTMSRGRLILGSIAEGRYGEGGGDMEDVGSKECSYAE